MKPVKISKYFTYDELFSSNTAEKYNIRNIPTPAQFGRVLNLCNNLMDPLRSKLRKAIHVTSGFRCNTLDFAIKKPPEKTMDEWLQFVDEKGMETTSQHEAGQAIDSIASGMPVEDYFQYILASGLKFDQCIQEFDRWVHLSFRLEGSRMSILRAIKYEGGRTKYIPYTPK